MLGVLQQQQIINHLLSRSSWNQIRARAYRSGSPRGNSLSEMSKLPPSERAKHCRAHAMDARLKATTCSGDLQASYIKLAGQWEQLAQEAENEADAAVSSSKISR